MKKKGLVLFLLSALLFTACGTEKNKTEETDKLTVVTSFYPVYLLAQEIVQGAEGIRLENMAQPQTGCLHDYELSIYDCFVDSSKTKNAVIKTKYNNLYIIPSSSDLSAAEIELAYEDKREFFLKNAIDMIKENFDYIIIDSPPALGMITINIMTASDSVLIPIQCEYYALEGLSQLITTIKTIKKKLNPQIEIEGVLGTMYDGRTNLSIQVLDEVKKYFPDKVYKTIIPRNVRLSESPSFGEPIINYDRTSKGADAYMALAKEVIRNNK